MWEIWVRTRLRRALNARLNSLDYISLTIGSHGVLLNKRNDIKIKKKTKTLCSFLLNLGDKLA